MEQTTATPLSLSNLVACDPLVIADYQVLAHKVYNSLDESVARLGMTGSPEFREQLIAKWIRANWTLLLNRLSPDLPLHNYRLILVNDRKLDGKYWRHELYPEYKGNRSKKPPEFSQVLEVGLEIAGKMGTPVLSLDGFEADDIAGWLVRNLSDRQLVLLTIDTDWLQLVSPSVLWCNTAHWLPVLRGEREVCEWAKRRHKWTISNPGEIANFKAKYGDKADNLPPGSDLCLISLTEQPLEIRDRMDEHREQWLAAANGAPRIDTSWYSKSRLWCTKTGLGSVL